MLVGYELIQLFQVYHYSDSDVFRELEIIHLETDPPLICENPFSYWSRPFDNTGIVYPVTISKIY